MHKMIVMDMDGTLLSADKEIQKVTKEALMNAQKNGVKLVLASGRPQVGLIDFAYELEMDKYDGYLISFNGARLTSMRTMETVWEESISKEDAKEILDHLEKFDVLPMIQDETYMYVNNVYNGMIQVNGEPFNIIEYESRGGNYLLSEKRHLGEGLENPLYKILIAGEVDYLQKVHKELSDPFTERYNAMFTAPFYYEFTHKLADKGLALTELSKMTNIPLEDMIGFGDDLNDLPFLKIVGHAVAMDNSNPKIIEHVDVVCGHHSEDGIGHYLNQLIKDK